MTRLITFSSNIGLKNALLGFFLATSTNILISNQKWANKRDVRQGEGIGHTWHTKYIQFGVVHFSTLIQA